MHELADAQLLRAYAQQGDQAAFRELVTRYSDLVYSAALRQVNAPDPARDIAQSVFTDLALKARSLADKLPTDGSLAGWLHRSTRFAVLNLLRDVRRRRANERQAMEQLRTNSEPEPEWDGIRPVLDEALDSLDDEDRDALLLRFFKNHDFRTIGAALGVSDDTAQKRVSRALDRLRAEFNRRGVTTSAVALTAALSANAVAVGPAGLAATLSSAALTSSTLATAATATATKAIAMTTLQKTIIGATLAVAVGTGVYKAHEASQLRAENQTLQQQQAPLNEQIQQLQRERDEAANRLSALADEMHRIKGNSTELLKLRGEVARLRSDSKELARLKATNAKQQDDPMGNAMKSWMARVNDLKQRFEQTPGAKIPELKFLTDQTWLDVAKGQFKTEEDYQKALATLRMEASTIFLGSKVEGPLMEYVQANNGQFPNDISQLQPYLKTPEDRAILERYQIIPAIYLGQNAEMIGEWAITQKTPVDEQQDVRVSMGLKGTVRSYYTQTDRALDSAINAFAAANGGRMPQGIYDLQPYISTAEQEAFQKRIRENRAKPHPASVPINR